LCPRFDSRNLLGPAWWQSKSSGQSDQANHSCW
jgi:hypothetical protein